MNSKMNMLFEPANLEQASPATVSRCGMIYVESKQLGWRSFWLSYKENLWTKLLPDQQIMMDDMIEWLVSAIFDFTYRHCSLFLAMSENHMFNVSSDFLIRFNVNLILIIYTVLKSFTRLINCLVKEEIGAGISTTWLGCITIFSLIWSLGSTIRGDSRNKFDAFFRKLISGSIDQYQKPQTFKLTKNQLFPDNGTIYDYVYDKKNNGTWILWSEKLDLKRIPPDAKVIKLLYYYFFKIINNLNL